MKLENLNRSKHLLYDGSSKLWSSGTTIALTDDVRNYSFILVVMTDGKVNTATSTMSYIRDLIPMMIPTSVLTHKENNMFPYISMNTGQPDNTTYTIHFALTNTVTTCDSMSMGTTGGPSMSNFKIYGIN